MGTEGRYPCSPTLSLKGRDQDLIKLQSRSADVQQRYDQLRDDHSDLKERYRTLSQDHNRVVAQSLAQDKKEQSEWKIENLTKNNRALEVANTELRKDLQEVKDENLQVGATMKGLKAHLCVLL